MSPNILVFEDKTVFLDKKIGIHRLDEVAGLGAARELVLLDWELHANSCCWNGYARKVVLLDRGSTRIRVDGLGVRVDGL